MTAKTEKEIIHREFELERVILFSDAVFAIAITLLIIDIKFPEIPENIASVGYWSILKPVVFEFLALCISFFFIGMFWSRHLSLFRYLQGYNQGLIVRNLFFLFFIVLFPFAAEAIAGHMKPYFMLPLYIYFGNIFLCTVMHLWLCHYIFYKQPSLSIAGHHDEKKYIYLRSKVSVIMIGLFLFASIMVGVLFPQNIFAFLTCIYLLPVVAIIARKRLKKYKPKPLQTI